MASTTKEVLIKRLASSPGKGVGANTGLGSSDVVVPEFPKLPEKLTQDSVREFSDAVERWRSGLQAQFPIPNRTATATAVTSDNTSDAIATAVAEITRQINAINSGLSSKVSELQKQIESIGAGGITADEVERLIKNARYVHSQGVPASVWTINHYLGWHPSVTAVDRSNNLFIGNVKYIDDNSCQLVLFAEVSGYAYLN